MRHTRSVMADLLPAGLLREPLTSLKRAQAAILSRCDLVTAHELVKIEDQLLEIIPELVLAQTIMPP